MTRLVVSHLVTVVVTYLLCGAWIVAMCDHGAWPWRDKAEIAATWAWRFWIISDYRGWRRSPAIGGDA